MTQSVCRITEFFTIWELPDGRRHREDGPAIEWGNGTTSWYLKGVAVAEALISTPEDPKLARLVAIKAVYDIMND